MKTKIILLILILSGITAYPQNRQGVIIIESIGISDKPLNTLYISKEKVEGIESDNFRKNFIVKKKIYRKIRRIILRLNTSTTIDKKKEYEYGCFRIDVESSIVYVISKRESSIKYFKELRSELSKIDNCSGIVEQLSLLIIRIS